MVVLPLDDPVPVGMNVMVAPHDVPGASVRVFAHGVPPLPTAVNITSTSARLGGTITTPGTSTPTVTVYYGNEDAGASLIAWDSSVACKW